MDKWRFLWSHSVINSSGPFSFLVMMSPVFLVTGNFERGFHGAIFIGIVFILVHFADRLVDLFQSARVLRAIAKKVDKGASSAPVFRDYEDYLGEDVGRSIDIGSISNSGPSNAVKSYLFQYTTTREGSYLGTFALPVSPGLSFIFTSYKPEDLNPARLNTLLHEVGHADEDSWHRSRGYWGAQFATLFILAISVQEIATFVLGLVVWLCALGYTRLSVSEARFLEETRADVTGLMLQLLCIGSNTVSNQGKVAQSMAETYWERRRKALPKDRTLTAFQVRERAKIFATFNETESQDFDIIYKQSTSAVRLRRVLCSIPLIVFAAFALIIASSAPAGVFLEFWPVVIAVLIFSVILAGLCFLTAKWVVRSFVGFGNAFISLDEHVDEIDEFYANTISTSGINDHQIDYEKIRALYEKTFPIYEMIKHFSDFGYSLRKERDETFAILQGLKDAPPEALEEFLLKMEDPEFKKIGDDFREGQLGRKNS